MAGSLGNTDNICAALDLFVEALNRIGGVYLPPVGLRERLVGLDQLGPVFFRACLPVLVKGCSERRRDNGAVLLADAGQRVAHEMHATALDGGPQRPPSDLYVHPLSGRACLDNPRLCCTNPLRDSCYESSVVTGMHEQTHSADLQDYELDCLQ